MGAILTSIKALGGSAIEMASGLSFHTWAYIAAVAAIALLIWLAYSWAWDRGAAHQQAKDASEIARLTTDNATLKGNVATLQAGIDDRNRQIDAYAAAEHQREADAEKKAMAALDVLTASRAREKSRGFGPDPMNDFMSDISGAAR